MCLWFSVCYTTNALRLTVSTLNRQVASDLKFSISTPTPRSREDSIIDHLPATCCKAARNCRVDACGCT